MFSLPFQAIRLLRVSAKLESRANALRKEALQCLTVALCGSDTKQFWQLLTAYFGANHTGGEEDDPWDFIDPAPAIPRPLPLTDTESDDETSQASTATSSKAPPAGTPVGEGAKAKGSARRQPTLTVKKDILEDVCEPLKAIRMYPTSEDTLNETGIPVDLRVSREQSTTATGGLIYLCRHTVCQEGTPFLGQSPAALYSHVRRKHLGLVLACPYCAHKVYWNTRGWKAHMSTHHSGAPHYGTAIQDEAIKAHELLAKDSKSSSSRQDSPKPRRRKPKATKPKKAEPSSSSSSLDSSPDSSSSDSDHKQSMPEPKCEPKCEPPPMAVKKEFPTDPAAQLEYARSLPPDPLTSQQQEFTREGAHSLRGQPTLESLIIHPHAWKQPVPSIVASRDLAVHPPPGSTIGRKPGGPGCVA